MSWYDTLKSKTQEGWQYVSSKITSNNSPGAPASAEGSAWEKAKSRYNYYNQNISERIPTYESVIRSRQKYEMENPRAGRALDSFRSTTYKIAGRRNVDTFAGFGKGVYSQVQERPLDVAAQVGVGAATTPVFGAVSKIPSVARAGAAISKIPRVGSTIAKHGVPATLGTVWGGSIYSRINEPIIDNNFKRQKTSIEKAETFGRITSGEIVPVFAGAGAYGASEKVLSKAPAIARAKAPQEILIKTKIKSQNPFEISKPGIVPYEKTPKIGVLTGKTTNGYTDVYFRANKEQALNVINKYDVSMQNIRAKKSFLAIEPVGLKTYTPGKFSDNTPKIKNPFRLEKRVDLSESSLSFGRAAVYDDFVMQTPVKANPLKQLPFKNDKLLSSTSSKPAAVTNPLAKLSTQKPKNPLSKVDTISFIGNDKPAGKNVALSRLEKNSLKNTMQMSGFRESISKGDPFDYKAQFMQPLNLKSTSSKPAAVTNPLAKPSTQKPKNPLSKVDTISFIGNDKPAGKNVALSRLEKNSLKNTMKMSGFRESISKGDPFDYKAQFMQPLNLKSTSSKPAAVTNPLAKLSTQKPKNPLSKVDTISFIGNDKPAGKNVALSRFEKSSLKNTMQMSGFREAISKGDPLDYKAPFMQPLNLKSMAPKPAAVYTNPLAKLNTPKPKIKTAFADPLDYKVPFMKPLNMGSMAPKPAVVYANPLAKLSTPKPKMKTVYADPLDYKAPFMKPLNLKSVAPKPAVVYANPLAKLNAPRAKTKATNADPLRGLKGAERKPSRHRAFYSGSFAKPKTTVSGIEDVGRFESSIPSENPYDGSKTKTGKKTSSNTSPFTGQKMVPAIKSFTETSTFAKPKSSIKTATKTATATKSKFVVPDPLAKMKGLRPGRRGIKANIPDLQIPDFGNSKSLVSKKRSGKGREKNLYNKYGDPLLMASVAEKSVTNMLKRRR